MRFGQSTRSGNGSPVSPGAVVQVTGKQGDDARMAPWCSGAGARIVTGDGNASRDEADRAANVAEDTVERRGSEAHDLAPVIEIRGLVKRYGTLVAVDGIDLSVRPGEIFGILGPNGAGKTTTLEMIEGLRHPDGGTIRVAGFDAVAEASKVRQVIGVQLQTTALFDYLTASEIVELFASLYNVDSSKARVNELLSMVGLQEKRSARVDELSGGQRQRLSIALALVNQPKIVFLDEPTTGLDPAARRDLWQTIRSIQANGTTVVLTTHYMEEAETLCDRVAIMDRGRIIACDTPQALIRRLGATATIQASFVNGALPLEILAHLPGVLHSAGTDGRLELRTADAQATLVALLDEASRSGVTLADLRSTQPSLEDVFLALTGRAYEGEGAGEAAQQEEPPARRRRRRQ